MELVALAPTLVVACLLWLAFLRTSTAKRLAAELELTGQRSDGIILGIESLGSPDSPRSRLKVQVDAPADSSFTAELDRIVSMAEMPRMQPGCRVSVLYDPADKNRIVVSPAGSVSAFEAQCRLRRSETLIKKLNYSSQGIHAEATVTEFVPSNVTINDAAVLARLRVEVLPRVGTPYEAVIDGGFSPQGLTKYQAGRTVDVLYNPQNLSEVTLNLNVVPYEISNPNL